MVHDARIVPLAPRDPLPDHVRQRMGDSRGRWEGDTLVIETSNLDRLTWTRPWSVEVPMARSSDEVWEFACHEGNYGMHGILIGHRAEERRAREQVVRRTEAVCHGAEVVCHGAEVVWRRPSGLRSHG